MDGDYVQRDQLLIPPECFFAADLNKCIHTSSVPGLGDQRFSLSLSVEVAEHLSPDVADGFVGLLARYADVIVFSAAIPHQGGTHHVNEQWPDYWIGLFENLNYRLYDVLRWRIWEDRRVEPWYRQNLLLFVKQESILPRLESATSQTRLQLNVVHPDFWLRAVEYFNSSDHLSRQPTGLLVRVLIEQMRQRLSAVIKIHIHKLMHIFMKGF